jgi:hypothetical protein
MTNIGELVKTFMDDFNAATPAIRIDKREYATLEFFKWELIRDEIRKFDAETETND